LEKAAARKADNHYEGEKCMPTLKRIIAVGALAIALIVGVAAYAVFKTPAASSGQIQAIPLAASATQVSTTAAQPTTADAASGAAVSTTSAVTLQMIQAESEARFIIDEVLNDAPKTVIGTTDQVAGEIAINPQDPTQTRVGVIQIDARALTTDNDFRNRAIKNQILETDQYEYVTFTPTKLVGLPQTGAVGTLYTFQIVGDLTIRDVTKPVTFDVTATAAAGSRIEGTATATIAYADYGISIPQVRQVASVDDQVRLELDFVAAAA
jgi:polyisoprenoid-binding protein YceI